MRLSREGQTHSAKNAKPLLTTIHPFPVTLGEPALEQEGEDSAVSLRVHPSFVREPASLLEFFLTRSAYVRNKPWIGSLVVLVIAASLAEAEVAVDRSTDHVCISVILPVILPPAHLA
jgi:hypothetical protein